jgi:hypothetical protein
MERSDVPLDFRRVDDAGPRHVHVVHRLRVYPWAGAVEAFTWLPIILPSRPAFSTTGQDGEIQHGLALVAEARGLHRRTEARAVQRVDDQRGQGWCLSLTLAPRRAA